MPLFMSQYLENTPDICTYVKWANVNIVDD